MPHGLTLAEYTSEAPRVARKFRLGMPAGDLLAEVKMKWHDRPGVVSVPLDGFHNWLDVIKEERRRKAQALRSQRAHTKELKLRKARQAEERAAFLETFERLRLEAEARAAVYAAQEAKRLVVAAKRKTDALAAMPAKIVEAAADLAARGHNRGPISIWLKEQGLTLLQVGLVLGVSQERARQIIAKAERAEAARLARTYVKRAPSGPSDYCDWQVWTPQMQAAEFGHRGSLA
jgi:hypothetical protein